MQTSSDPLDHQIQQRAQQWLRAPFDEKTQSTVREWLSHDRCELQDAFWKDLEFGTGGMRGIMGHGSSRMNQYNVQRATQGLCHWLLSKHAESPLKAVIAYDSRNYSRDFAWHSACVFAANGIEVYLFEHLRPTPMLSFAVRHLHAQCGIMITASHNPPQYNGFKIYNSEGCQYYLPEDEEIVQAVQNTAYNEIKASEPSDRRIHVVGSDIDQHFLDALQEQQRCSDANKKLGEQLLVIYSSLHGTGITLAPQALASWGFSKVVCVDAQSKPDGNFPTVTAPNPEDSSALELGVQQLLAHRGDLLIANDPDGDRMGVAVRHEGRSRILNGQEIGLLLADHILRHSDPLNNPTPALIKSIVTSNMIEAMGRTYNIPVYNVLPGFKYFGRLILQWQQTGKHRFLFGAEESHGYLAGLHARDKDGMVAACLIAEAALQCKLQKITLVDRLEQLYHQYGRYGHRLITISQPDTMEGRQKLSQIMQNLRSHQPHQLGAWKISDATDLLAGAKEPMVSADVLIWQLTPQAQVIIRPSGTEPKIKIYISHHVDGDDALLSSRLRELESHLRTLFK